MVRRPSGQIAAIVSLGAALLLGLVFGGWAFVEFVRQLAGDLERRDALSIATTVASAFEPDEIESLRAGDRAALLEVRSEMMRVGRSLGGVRYVHVLERRNGIIGILADTDDEAAPHSHPLLFPDAERAMNRVLDSGSPEVVGPYRDAEGEWVSSIAPIFDAGRHSTQAAVAFEFSAETWQENVGRFASFALAIIALIGALAGFFMTGLFVQVRHQLRIARLNANLEREVAELALSNQIVENSTTIVFRLEPKTLSFTYVSRNVERYGYKLDALLQVPERWKNLFHPDDLPAMNADVQNLIEGKIDRARREVRFRKADGTWLWFDGQITAVRDASSGIAAFEGLLFDITETKKAEERIRYLANHDALTGLANRAAFVSRLQSSFAEGKRGGPGFAVHYMDVDHFKDINDALGETCGDLFLKAVATRLDGVCRETDTLGRFSIARLGGDEFALLQHDVSEPADAAALAQRLNKILAMPFVIDGKDVHATVSIGVALYGKDIKDPNDMLSQADLALHRAKEGGRNRFHFHSNELDTAVRERVAITEDLHAAIQKHELELYYQPQVAIPSGRIIGVEALMRWNHPQRGLVPPSAFIPIAEKSGLIVTMGRWAIEEACRQMQAWRAGGVEPSTMGVNVSAVQIRSSPDFDREVEEILRRTGTDPEALELELTESILIETTETHNRIFHRLREMGVRIAIDDFGTGYSSLQYLQSYPITRIKIAQQFMREASEYPSDEAIVRATIGLARGLKIDLIAEGVESQTQIAFLRAAGCPAVQGYFFSRPVPAKQATELLRQKRFEYARRAPSAPPASVRAQQGAA